jgi:thioredoxin-related protein
MKKILSALFICGVAGALMAADSSWLTSLPDAKVKAEKEQKLVLLDFTGSDWCPYCQKLHAEVFSKSEFTDYAKKNLVLVKVDLLKHHPQTEEVKATNKALKAKYQVTGYPTLVLVKPDGTVVWKQVGYDNEPPSVIITKLDEAKAK